MKICYIASGSDHYTGYQIYGFMLCCALREIGHDVEYITDSPPIFLNDFEHLYLLPTIKLANIFDEGTVIADDFDVIISAPIYGTGLGISHMKFNEAKLYHHLCEEPGFVMSNDERRRPFDGDLHPIYQRIRDRLVNNGDGVILAHPFFVPSFKKWVGDGYDGDILTISPCINERAITRMVNRGKDNMICVSRNAPHKRLSHLIHVLKGNPSLTLTLITNEGESIRRMAASEGCLSRLTIYHALNDEEKYAAIMESVAVISPSMYEGFGMSLLDAFASGRPFIGYDIEPYKAITNEKGVYLSFPDKPDVLAQTVSKVLDEKPGVYAEKCKEGRNLYMKYSFNEMVARCREQFPVKDGDNKVKTAVSVPFTTELFTDGVVLEEL